METTAEETCVSRDGDIRYAVQWRWRFVETCNGMRLHPVPEKQSTRNYRQDNRLMEMVINRYTRTIETVAVGENAAKMEVNKGQRREAKILV